MLRVHEKIKKRHATAEAFRVKLLAELGPGDSASRESLVQVAVSCYIEIAELSASFLTGHQRAKGRVQLGLARGQLQRALRSLGLIDRDEADASSDPAASVKSLITMYEGKPTDGNP